MGEGRREDIEAIWKVAFLWTVNSAEGNLGLLKTKDGRPRCWGSGGQLRTWAGMAQIISMTEQEWQVLLGGDDFNV